MFTVSLALFKADGGIQKKEMGGDCPAYLPQHLVLVQIRQDPELIQNISGEKLCFPFQSSGQTCKRCLT